MLFRCCLWWGGFLFGGVGFGFFGVYFGLLFYECFVGLGLQFVCGWLFFVGCGLCGLCVLIGCVFCVLYLDVCYLGLVWVLLVLCEFGLFCGWGFVWWLVLFLFVLGLDCLGCYFWVWVEFCLLLFGFGWVFGLCVCCFFISFIYCCITGVCCLVWFVGFDLLRDWWLLCSGLVVWVGFERFLLLVFIITWLCGGGFCVVCWIWFYCLFYMCIVFVVFVFDLNWRDFLGGCVCLCGIVLLDVCYFAGCFDLRWFCYCVVTLLCLVVRFIVVGFDLISFEFSGVGCC